MQQLEKVWSLYGDRSAGLQKLFAAVASDVSKRGYTHASVNQLEFAGRISSSRPLVDELIHQHMDAYLEKFGLLAQKIDALTFFLGQL